MATSRLIAGTFAFWAILLAVASPITAETTPAQTIRVKTAEEFLTALGSDRILQLDAGEYILSDVPDRKMEAVKWSKVFEGKTITVRNLKNLKIIGVGKDPAHLIVRPAEAFVLEFSNCQNLTLENLKLGHAPEKGYCVNGVVGITDSTNITLRKCDLYGCGTEALTLKNSKEIQVEGSILRDCSAGILSISQCKTVTFLQTRMTGNEGCLQIEDSEDIALTDCTLDNNTVTDAALIQAISCTNIMLNNCDIHDNTGAELTDNPRTVKFDGGKREDNKFSKPE